MTDVKKGEEAAVEGGTLAFSQLTHNCCSVLCGLTVVSNNGNNILPASNFSQVSVLNVAKLSHRVKNNTQRGFWGALVADVVK